MKTKLIVLALAVALTTLGLLLLPRGWPARGPTTQPAAAPPGGEVQVAGLSVVGPYTHGNLGIFLLRGKDRVRGKNFLTLKEALEQKKIVVGETGNVQELTIENTGDRPVYIQAGEVLRGGKQDRMCPYDYVIAPGSGKQPLASFCVEHGRWTRRGQEAEAVFNASNNFASNAVTLAGKLNNDQALVWSQVSAAQNKLSDNVGVTVNAAASPSSLELSLGSRQVQDALAGYRQALADLPGRHDDAVGFAVAVNGRIVNVDVYACHELLEKLWPKLLQAAATEAVAEKKAGVRFDPPTAKDVQTFVAGIEKARATERRINDQLKMKVQETPSAAGFHSWDDTGSFIIHQSYVSKQPPQPEGGK